MSKRRKPRRFQSFLRSFFGSLWLILLLLVVPYTASKAAELAGYYPPPRTSTPTPPPEKIYDLEFGKIYTIESCKIRHWLFSSPDYYITVRDEDGNRYVLFLDELPQGFIAAVPGDKIMRTSTNIIKVP